MSLTKEEIKDTKLKLINVICWFYMIRVLVCDQAKQSLAINVPKIKYRQEYIKLLLEMVACLITP